MAELIIRRGLAAKHIEHVLCLNALLAQPATQAGRKLGVDQAPHQAARTTR